MPAAAKLIAKIGLSPIWLLWRFYLILWWAFNDEPIAAARPAKQTPEVDVPPLRIEPDSQPGPRTQRVAQEAAFEIIDTTPAPAPRPIGALKGGFAVSLVLAALLAFALHSAATHEVIRHSIQLPLWIWASCMVFVGSLWPVRHIARRQAAAQPTSLRTHAACIAGGVKDMSVSAYAAAKQATTFSANAGKRVASAANTMSDGARRLWNRRVRKTA